MLVSISYGIPSFLIREFPFVWNSNVIGSSDAEGYNYSSINSSSVMSQLIMLTQIRIHQRFASMDFHETLTDNTKYADTHFANYQVCLLGGNYSIYPTFSYSMLCHVST